MAEQQAPPAGREISDQDKATQACDALEEGLVQLKAAYEQHFLGFERRPPAVQHQALRRRMVALKESFVRQTAIKFRIANLHTKFLTYERLWARTLQEMEAGTYHRDVFKARMHAQRKAAAELAEKTKLAEPPRTPPAPDGGLTDAKAKAIFDAYVLAKRRCNEDVSKLTFEAMKATLKKQIPALLQQNKATTVDFKVVIKDGKAVLRAVPKG